MLYTLNWKHKTRKALPLRLALKLAFKAVSLLEDRLFILQGNGRFINARPKGRFINAEATGWPDLQISATNCIFAIIPHDQFISGRAKLFSAKAGPMAVLSTRGPMAVLSTQKQPDGQTSRFQRQIAFSLLSRTISLSAAGPSYFQQKHAQWPFYQRRPNGRFMQAEATGWPDLQISTTNCIFAIIPLDTHKRLKFATLLFCDGLQRRPHCLAFLRRGRL